MVFLKPRRVQAPCIYWSGLRQLLHLVSFEFNLHFNLHLDFHPSDKTVLLLQWPPRHRSRLSQGIVSGTTKLTLQDEITKTKM